MFKCSCRKMKCDEGSDAWNNLRISHIHVFLKNLGQHVPRRKTWSSRKFGERICFWRRWRFQMKEFRTTLIYYIGILYMSMFQYRLLCFRDPHLMGGNAWRRKSNACVKKNEALSSLAEQTAVMWKKVATSVSNCRLRNHEQRTHEETKKSSLLVLTVS